LVDGKQTVFESDSRGARIQGKMPEEKHKAKKEKKILGCGKVMKIKY